MIVRPEYYERVQAGASQRWDQLDADRELAGPWHQLFRQVQSPRHVLSELLQNADDAGATEASVRIEDGEFEFTHNGDDFTEEHFASLCGFGWSNKRSLHTIGFRGVGFKSTFSLGDEVRLLTPTLSVAFRRRRFTEPVWIDGESDDLSCTQVRVAIADQHRQLGLEKNLQDWLTNPASLLFLRNIERLRIGDQDLCWEVVEPGPVEESDWVALSTSPEQTYLHLWSSAEDLPEEAIDEIRQERMLWPEDEADFPACRVEIVLGMEGRLFVILPTGVTTALPFACNAPFVQDPARVKIKDPGISPTNRWLLRRVGRLAAAGMLAWLRRSDLDIEQRAAAYALFPDVNREDSSLEGSCATIVKEAFEAAVEGQRYLLCDTGELEARQGCVGLPAAVLDIWSTEQAAALFADGPGKVLSRHIGQRDRQKLHDWGVFQERGKAHIISVLESTNPPRPKSWRQLLALWAYVADEVTGYHYYSPHTGVRIVPIQGARTLHAASQVVRLGDKKLLQSDKDWEFLSQYLLVLNQNWPRFLAKQRRSVEQRGNHQLGGQVQAAYTVLDRLELSDASDASRVVQQVATQFFAEGEPFLADCVRLAQIAAKLAASVGTAFRFVTQDEYVTSTSWGIIADVDGSVEGLVEDSWAHTHLLHEAYHQEFRACTRAEWREWVSSERSELLGFVPISPSRRELWSRSDLRGFLQEHGCHEEPYYPYVTHDFIIEDWDFGEEHWLHWHAIAGRDPKAWGRLVTLILDQPRSYWAKAISLKIMQVATTGRERQISCGSVLPAWIAKLRRLACLQDTHGYYRRPEELLCRTPETEPLIEVEPFVDWKLDTEGNRPLLLKLGVRDKPTGPDRLLDCLRALAKAQQPPIHEVEKWYRRLDQMVESCSTEEYQKIKQALTTEKLVLTEDNAWVRASEVFLAADEDDVPGAAVILPAVRELMLWRKVGVAERPTADLAIAWLQGLPEAKPLSQDELRRVRSLLPRHADRIWDECQHWLNLEGQWTPVNELAYALTMQSLTPRANLFSWVKQKTADFLRLGVEMIDRYPFSQLPTLASRIEDRFEQPARVIEPAKQKAWLTRLGAELGRIVLDDEGETERVRELAVRLLATTWQETLSIETTPYIDGTPAGTPRQVDVLWKDTVLYVVERPLARLARSVAQELGAAFARQDIADAIKLCFERSPEFVSEYMEENFRLTSPEEVRVSAVELGSDEAGAGQVEAGDGAGRVPLAQLVSAAASSGDPSPGDGQETGLLEGGLLDSGRGDAQIGVLDATLAKPKPAPRPPSATLMERFAHQHGYVKDGPHRFHHSDGSWMARTTGHAFPWERRAASGELVQYYWPKDHCIQEQPLELQADVWALCDAHPQRYSLILCEPDGSPLEISGTRLRQMCEAGVLRLYPASYRLVYDDQAQD